MPQRDASLKARAASLPHAASAWAFRLDPGAHAAALEFPDRRQRPVGRALPANI